MKNETMTNKNLLTAHETIAYMRETCSEEFMNETLICEFIGQMGSNEANRILERICRMWNIVTPYTHDAEEVAEANQ